eukprot:g21045.t1
MGMLADGGDVAEFFVSQGVLSAYHPEISPDMAERGGEEGMKDTKEVTYHLWPPKPFLKLPFASSLELEEEDRGDGAAMSRRHKKRREKKTKDRRRGGDDSSAFYPAFGYGGPWHMPQPWPYGPVDDGVDVKVSSKFLTRNDYCQTFIDTGLRPQNFIRDLDYQNRCLALPGSSPGMFLKCDLKTFDLASLGTKFDVVLLDPPWEEYQTRVAGMYVPDEDLIVQSEDESDLSTWTLDELKALKVGEVADHQSFVFLWCGETHLEHGRELFKKWGFRRIEDICWVKTNRQAELDQRGSVKQQSVMYGDSSIIQRTKEHCLVGVKGTVKRSVDTHFIHANCDVDLIMEEPSPSLWGFWRWGFGDLGREDE